MLSADDEKRIQSADWKQTCIWNKWKYNTLKKLDIAIKSNKTKKKKEKKD